MIKNNLLRWAVALIPALLIAASGAAKLAHAEPVVQTLTPLGLGPYITALGVLELVIAGLFVYPMTRNVGFFMACSYFGGAMATHLAHHESFTSPLVLLVVFWVVMLLIKPSLFISSH